MATVVQFTIDDSGVKKLVDAADRIEASDKERLKSEKQIANQQAKEAKARLAEEKRIAKEEERAAKEKLKKEKEVAKAAEKARKEKEKQIKAESAARKKEFEDTRKLISGDLSPLLEGKGAKGAGIEAALKIGTGVLAGLSFAGAAFLKISVDAAKARREAGGMIEVMAGADPKALQKVDEWAKFLNRDIKETREQFIDFRSRGLSNKEALQLIKTFADLRKERGELVAEAAVSGAFADISRGVEFADSITKIHEQTGILGDGMIAAQKEIKSVDDIVTNLKNDFLEASEETGLFADAVARLVSGDGSLADLNRVSSDVNLVAEKIFGTPEEIDTATKKIFEIPFNKRVDRLKKIGSTLPGVFKDAGKESGKGFTEGFSGSNVISNVKKFGSSILSGFKNILGISSPSKEFMKDGMDSAEGYSLGIQKGSQRAEDTAEAMGEGSLREISSVFSRPNETNEGDTVSNTTNRGMSIVQNITVPAGINADEFSQSLRREMELFFRAQQLQRGSA